MRFCLALLMALGLSGPALTEEPVEVDLELFLAVDVSRSMQPFELEIQREGYAAALSSPDVIDRILNGGMIGRIAITYVEWAGVGSRRIVVPWTLVDSAEDARAVAAQITAHFDPSMRRTSISDALLYAQVSMAENRFSGLRRVIDISGDGPNNAGYLVMAARDRVLADGITINGLPLMTMDDFSSRWGIADLDIYYQNCVIGGPGAFMLPVRSWEEFPAAIKRKLMLEIADAAPQPRVQPIQAYNCRIGEEIWERNSQGFWDP